MGLYDALNPERAVLYLDMKDSYDEVYGDNLIVGDPYDPVNWTPNNNPLLTRVINAYNGSDALRVESTGTSYASGIKTILTIGRRYRVAAAIRVNASPTIGTVNNANTNILYAATADFRSLVGDFTATHANFILYNQPTAAGTYSDFADLSLYELRRVCKNHGGLGPATVQLGNGFTGTSFPTMVKNGMSFDSGDYINCGQAGANLVDNFTVYVLDYPADFITNRTLISRYTGSSYQWWFFNNANGLQTVRGTTSYKSSTQNNKTTNTPKVKAFVSSGGQVKYYNNGYVDGIAESLPITQQSCDTIVGMLSPISSPYNGIIYNIALFPEAHSQQQIKEMTRRMMQNKFIG